jgi:hypothetical protein
VPGPAHITPAAARRAIPDAARSAMRASRLIALPLLAAVAFIGACSRTTPPKSDLLVRVVAGPGGGTIDEMDIRTTAGILDIELGRIGFERRQVMPTADGRIRIVLPESQASRMPEVRALLAEPRLRVQIVE